jgi:hypothetical protein
MPIAKRLGVLAVFGLADEGSFCNRNPPPNRHAKNILFESIELVICFQLHGILVLLHHKMVPGKAAVIKNSAWGKHKQAARLFAIGVRRDCSVTLLVELGGDFARNGFPSVVVSLEVANQKASGWALDEKDPAAQLCKPGKSSFIGNEGTPSIHVLRVNGSPDVKPVAITVVVFELLEASDVNVAVALRTPTIHQCGEMTRKPAILSTVRKKDHHMKNASEIHVESHELIPA